MAVHCGYLSCDVYLGFQNSVIKALGKVPRQRLLIKLNSDGVKADILSQVRSWLKNRKQRVE